MKQCTVVQSVYLSVVWLELKKCEKYLTLYFGTGLIFRYKKLWEPKMQTLSTGQLAREANVNIQTIRYYERVGLLPETPRRESGYRQFSPDDVTRILFIKHAQQAGFLLKEIKELFALKVNSDSACEEIKERAEAKIVEIDEKIKRLEMMKQTLKTLTAMCSETGAKSECPILEAFESENFKVTL